MNHRERVQTALNHKQPDRVPIDIWGSASRICNLLYYKIAADQGWEDFGPRVSASRSGDYVDYRVEQLIQSDFKHTHVGKPKYFASYKDGVGNEYNEWGVGFKSVNGKSLISVCPLAGKDIDAIDRHSWPDPKDPGRCVGAKEQVQHWAGQGEYFIGTTSVVSGLALDICPYLRGFEEFMMDLYINPKFAHALIEKVTDVLIELYVNYLEPIGQWVDWVEFSSDHGMQDRSLMRLKTYQDFFKPHYRRLFDAVRKVAPRAKIWMHSCGSIREYIPDFIDMGVDVLNSLQPNAKNMDSFELKKEFGKDIVFHGGLNIQGGVNGTVQEAIDETKRCLDAFMPDGGYIFAPSNHYMEDISLENFYAIYKTVSEYGKYG